MVRSAVRRAFYEATYGEGTTNVTRSKAAFLDATFDEYVALMRIGRPAMTPRSAASQAYAFPAFRAMASTLVDDPMPKEAELVYWTPAKPRPRGANAVLLHGLKGVVDLAPARRMKPIRNLVAQRCSGAVAATRTRIDVERLEVDESPPAFVESLLSATRAPVVWWLAQSASVNLAWLAPDERLIELYARGAAVSNVDRLAGFRSLEKLELGRVALTRALTRSLAALSELEDLALATSDAIAPEHIPFEALRSLRRVVIPGHAPERDAWIAFAMAHPEVDFAFDAPLTAEPVKAPPKSEPVEEHRGVALGALVALGAGVAPGGAGKGKLRRFRIESDVATEVDYRHGSNGDLEDDLAAVALEQGKAIDWGSEAGTLVATCADLETCRWIVDQAIALAIATRGPRPKA